MKYNYFCYICNTNTNTIIMAKTNILFTQKDGNYEAEITIDTEVTRLHIEKPEYGTVRLYQKDIEASNYAVVNTPAMFGNVIDTDIAVGLTPVMLKIVSDTDVTEAFIKS